MIKNKINIGIFPWMLYIAMFVHTIYVYMVQHPSFVHSDESLLFVIVLIVFWIERRSIIATINENNYGYVTYGIIIFIIGLFIGFVGQSYPILYFELWGLIIMATGMVMTLSKKEYIKSALFIGISGTALIILGKVAPEILSSELAVGIAAITAKVLSVTVLPVVSNGVKLYFGPYTAEVTHACSGMNSIFSLLALSVLYLLKGITRKLWHICVLLILVIPVAIVTNIMRVVILVLITFYAGNIYAQGIYHDIAGVFVFIIALFIMVLIDQVLFHLGEKIKMH
jgi:exosortase